MATAVKNPSETPAPASVDQNLRLIRASVLGALYLAVCIVLVAYGVPLAWKSLFSAWITKNLGSFVDTALLAVAVIASGVGLVVAGVAIAGPNRPEGFRAGVFSIVAGLLLVFMISVVFGQLLENYLFANRTSTLGLVLTVGVGVGLIVGACYLALKGNFRHRLIAFEGQGWFRLNSYKSNQGRWVRRWTMVGMLTIIGTGVWTLDQHRTLTGNWSVRLPFTDSLRLILLPDARITVPLLLIAVGLWGAWRVVNFPTFADFLIATEAEMNKVSWSTRKRLVQDTIVVLVTVLLFTIFLLLVDALWGWILTRENLGGIVPKAAEKSKQETKETPW
jgi:preprotein translocase SecE subunit